MYTHTHMHTHAHTHTHTHSHSQAGLPLPDWKRWLDTFKRPGTSSCRAVKSAQRTRTYGWKPPDFRFVVQLEREGTFYSALCETIPHICLCICFNTNVKWYWCLIREVSSLQRWFLYFGTCKCVLIREVFSFQRVKCVFFINLRPCRCVLIREVSFMRGFYCQ